MSPSSLIDVPPAGHSGSPGYQCSPHPAGPGLAIGRNIPLYFEIFELAIDPKELQAGIMPFTVGLLAALAMFLSRESPSKA